MKTQQVILRRCTATLNLVCLTLMLYVPCAFAQLNFGSAGANGSFPPVDIPAGTTAITLNLNTGVVTFLPGGTTTTLPAVPIGGFADGVLNFSTFNLPAGITLTFPPNKANTPVTILTTGDVTIAGTINVDGQPGSAPLPGNGGPGGFRGGGGKTDVNLMAAGSGLGPGGGGGATGIGGSGNFCAGGGGGFASAGGSGFCFSGRSAPGTGGGIYGLSDLLFLIGGSGGGGGSMDDFGTFGGGGGGGGGAILIASSGNITMTGAITANGGAGSFLFSCLGGDGGSGGAIRLKTNALRVSGRLRAFSQGGGSCGGNGGTRRIRLEAVTFDLSGSDIFPQAPIAFPSVVRVPGVGVKIAKVGDQTVPDPPGGGLGQPDVNLPSPGIYTIEVAASGVPVGTTILVSAKPERGDPPVSGLTGALMGTEASSRATVALILPAGAIFLQAQATFQLP